MRLEELEFEESTECWEKAVVPGTTITIYRCIKGAHPYGEVGQYAIDLDSDNIDKLDADYYNLDPIDVQAVLYHLLSVTAEPPDDASRG